MMNNERPAGTGVILVTFSQFSRTILTTTSSTSSAYRVAS